MDKYITIQYSFIYSFRLFL